MWRGRGRHLREGRGVVVVRRGGRHPGVRGGVGGGAVTRVEGGHVQLGPVVRGAQPHRQPVAGSAVAVDGGALVHPVRVLLHVLGQIGLLNRDNVRLCAD